MAGFEKFRGNYFHSRNYKNPDGFNGKTVVIIGMGNSAADIAVEICRKAKKVKRLFGERGDVKI